MRPSFLENPSAPLIQAFDRGSRQFSLLWAPFVKQWTSPQLLRLTEAYLGCRLIHSSTLSGYATRRLRSPAIQGVAAIGLFNLALAKSVRWPQIDEGLAIPGLDEELPAYLETIWQGRKPLCDTHGIAMGPERLFAAFLGLLELSSDEHPRIPPEDAYSASQALAAFLRMRLPSVGCDWIVHRSAMASHCEALPALLLGETLTSEQLHEVVAAAAPYAQLTEEDLWAQIDTGIASANLGR